MRCTQRGVQRLWLHSSTALTTQGVRRFHYTMMAWLPTFFSDTLSLSLTQAAQVCCLPLAAPTIVMWHS